MQDDVADRIQQMASRKRKATTSQPREPYDTTRFISEVASERYSQNVHSRNILPERNVNLFVTVYHEFRRELIRRNWHKALTQHMDGHIDVALVKEFYSNLYDPEDKSPKQVRGMLIKFDATSLNAFLETPPLIQPGEQYPSYSIFCRTRTNPQELASKLCILGRKFVFNAEGAPWKLLRKDLTTLAQTWSVLSYSNLF
eukprot:XP_014628724.1 uncharacterized protein LOC102668221 [Glycine max]